MKFRTLSTVGIFALTLLSPSVLFAAPLPMAAALMAAANSLTATSTPATTTEAKPISAISLVGGLTSGDIIALTQPALVRIVAHYVGTTTIPSFDVDFDTMKWKMGTGATKQVPYDTYTAGSGFIVNPNGYIVTNTHVVSNIELKTALAKALAAGVILQKAFALTPAQNAKLSAKYTSEDIAKLAADGIPFIAGHLTIAPPTAIAVLRPTVASEATTTSAYLTQLQNSTTEALRKQAEAVVKVGYPATLLYTNDRYQDNEKDVALLHILQVNLPAIHLGNASSIREGDSVSVFGFPSSADMNGFTTEPTFTAGKVNSLKDSTQHTFKYIQTDAKISPGSSGGPMLDSAGNAIGVLTLSSVDDNGGAFAFAIPIDFASSVLAEKSVKTSLPNDYATHFLAALKLKNELHCEAANVEFTAALTASSAVSNVPSYVEPYIHQCEALIASGESLDSTFDYVRQWFKKLPLMGWVGIGVGVLVLVALVGGMVFLIRRFRKDEKIIETMQQGQTGQPSPSLPVEVPAALSSFIQSARQSGETNEEIVAALKTNGWTDAQITQALGM